MSSAASLSSSPRVSNVGHFSLCISGLPSNYTWKDLKDLVRNKAEHGIRADVVKQASPSGHEVTTGWAKVTRRTEALRLYDWLASERMEGRLLMVHIWDTSESPPKFMASNCHRIDRRCASRHLVQLRDVAQHMRDPGWKQDPPYQAAVMEGTPAYTAAPPIRYAPVAAAPTAMSASAALQSLQAKLASLSLQEAQLTPEQMGTLLRIQAQLQQQQQQQQQQQPQYLSCQAQYVGAQNPMAMYASAPSGAPVNTNHGFARTEVRGVFVQGLDFKTRTKDVEAMFSKAGKIKRCEVQKDSKGKSKGTATIEYCSAAEAQIAVQTFNNWRWNGRALKVRTDREAVVVDPPAPPSSIAAAAAVPSRINSNNQDPIIVNGSSGH